MNILPSVFSPEDVKKLSPQEMEQLCAEIREFLIQSIARSGGHLASNLGVVELTVALHKVFDTAVDRLIFDVGHQCYPHKLLTGRRDQFASLRQFDGLSGFQKTAESPHDAFGAGHASTSVSAALGMARARTLTQQHFHVIAVLGDGALTGGLAYEALSDAGQSHEPMIVILNDNNMSIQTNVGGVASQLGRLRLKPQYSSMKVRIKTATNRIPGGRAIYKLIHNTKRFLKNMLVHGSMFEDMGWTYLGPVDGHDLKSLIGLLEQAKEATAPVLLHVVTTKGKGYRYSEESPDEYHGISMFDVQSGKELKAPALDYSAVFGQKLCALARLDPSVTAITAAMTSGTGLSGFAEQFPKRFFDVGIAEGHAVTMAAGLASQGIKPVVAVYSTFLQRAYDMLIHDVALQKLHVVFAVDRAGLVGQDGETHQGLFDAMFLPQIPGMTVLCPANFHELEYMLEQALYDLDGPVAVRYPRGSEGRYTGICYGSSGILRSGKDLTFLSYGTMINAVLDAADLLAQHQIEAEIVKLNSLSPLNLPLVRSSVQKTGMLVVVEDCLDAGCTGRRILSELALEQTVPPKSMLFNLGDRFIPQGSVQELHKKYGLDGPSIAEAILGAQYDEKKTRPATG